MAGTVSRGRSGTSLTRARPAMVGQSSGDHREAPADRVTGMVRRHVAEHAVPLLVVERDKDEPSQRQDDRCDREHNKLDRDADQVRVRVW